MDWGNLRGSMRLDRFVYYGNAAMRWVAGAGGGYCWNHCCLLQQRMIHHCSLNHSDRYCYYYRHFVQHSAHLEKESPVLEEDEALGALFFVKKKSWKNCVLLHLHY